MLTNHRPGGCDCGRWSCNGRGFVFCNVLYLSDDPESPIVFHPADSIHSDLDRNFDGIIRRSRPTGCQSYQLQHSFRTGTELRIAISVGLCCMHQPY